MSCSLERLSANTGNLLDDEELIAVLAETKTKAVEVNEKLLAAGTTRASIDEKREQYRPAATRGSVLVLRHRGHVPGQRHVSNQSRSVPGAL